MSTRKVFNTQTMAKIAILSAIAFVLMLFDFALPFFPPFYKFDFSELAVLIGGFALGPIPAVIIEAIKILLNIVFTGSSTAYVGEAANFIIGCALVLPASIYYRNHKTKKAAIIGMTMGTLCMTIVGSAINYFVLIPLYSTLYGLPLDTIIGMGTALIPVITNKFTFVLFATAPFNLLKGIVTGILTVLLYKHISPILHK